MNRYLGVVFGALLLSCASSPSDLAAPPPPTASSSAPVLASIAPPTSASAPEPPATVVAPAPPPAPGPPPPPPPASMDACKLAEKKARAASAKWDVKPGPTTPSDYENRVVGPMCLSAGSKGTWGVLRVVEGFEQQTYIAWGQYTITITYFDAVGKRINGPSFRHSAVLPEDFAIVHDYGADGAYELLVAMAGKPGGIFTLKDEKIVSYPQVEGVMIDKFEDVDKDGRPDIRIATPYTPNKVLKCGKQGGHPLLNWVDDLQAVAHALPDGTFSMDDAVAATDARKECPSAPSVLVPKNKDGDVDNWKLRHNVVCARAWGVPAKTVIDTLTKECKFPKSANSDCTRMFEDRDSRTADPYCLGFEELSRWAEQKPPVLLK